MLPSLSFFQALCWTENPASTFTVTALSSYHYELPDLEIQLLMTLIPQHLQILIEFVQDTVSCTPSTSISKVSFSKLFSIEHNYALEYNFPLPTSGFWGSNRVCQGWQQVLFSEEPSWQPKAPLLSVLWPNWAILRVTKQGSCREICCSCLLSAEMKMCTLFLVPWGPSECPEMLLRFTADSHLHHNSTEHNRPRW